MAELIATGLLEPPLPCCQIPGPTGSPMDQLTWLCMLELACGLYFEHHRYMPYNGSLLEMHVMALVLVLKVNALWACLVLASSLAGINWHRSMDFYRATLTENISFL